MVWTRLQCKTETTPSAIWKADKLDVNGILRAAPKNGEINAVTEWIGAFLEQTLVIGQMNALKSLVFETKNHTPPRADELAVDGVLRAAKKKRKSNECCCSDGQYEGETIGIGLFKAATLVIGHLKQDALARDRSL